MIGLSTNEFINFDRLHPENKRQQIFDWARY
jgi:hypothetical protein